MLFVSEKIIDNNVDIKTDHGSLKKKGHGHFFRKKLDQGQQWRLNVFFSP